MPSRRRQRNSNKTVKECDSSSHAKHKQAYKYTVLQRPDSFRILVLWRGQKGSKLHASLKVTSLDQNDLKYEAMSYVWGAPDFCAEIEIDGQILPITNSAHEALERMRLPNLDRVLWIDGVCIDQSSPEDKSHQLKLMSRIYRQCTQCLAYLGPEQDRSELVPAFVEHLGQVILRKGSPLGCERCPALHQTMQNELPAAASLDAKSNWTAFFAFLCRPWFRRLWILQEAVLPPIVYLICGTWDLPLHKLYTLHRLHKTFDAAALLEDTVRPLDSDKIAKAWSQLDQQTEIRFRKGISCGWLSDFLRDIEADSQLPGERTPTIRDMVMTTSGCEVTDPRDRFYIALNLADSVSDEPTLTPNYNKQVSEVTNDYLSYFMRTGQGADILQTAPADPSRQSSCPTEPSWMSIWHNFEFRNETIKLPRSDMMRLHFDQSRWTAAVAPVSKSRLAVQGFVIDQVDQLTQKANDSSAEFLSQVFHIARSLNPEQELKPSAEVVWWPLIAGHDRLDRTPAPSSFLDQCEQWLQYKTSSPPPDPVTDAKTGKELHDQLMYVSFAVQHTAQFRYGSTNLKKAGMFPACSQSRDHIFLIDGSPRTFLIRHYPEADVYSWLGEVYVHDLEDHIEEIMSTTKPITITLV